jgi:hypothetical protein
MDEERPVVPGTTFRESKEQVVEDVKKQSAEWLKKELPKRMTATGRDENDVRKELEAEAAEWIENEVQRRMKWEDQENSEKPLEL